MICIKALAVGALAVVLSVIFLIAVMAILSRRGAPESLTGGISYDIGGLLGGAGAVLILIFVATSYWTFRALRRR